MNPGDIIDIGLRKASPAWRRSSGIAEAVPGDVIHASCSMLGYDRPPGGTEKWWGSISDAPRLVVEPGTVMLVVGANESYVMALARGRLCFFLNITYCDMAVHRAV